MSQIEVTINSLTDHLNSAKDAERKLAQLQRLCKNKDFKELILEDYSKNEAARLLQMSIHPSQSTEEQKKFLIMAQATGGIALYLTAQQSMLQTFVNQIPKIEAELESARNEDQGHQDDDGEE